MLIMNQTHIHTIAHTFIHSKDKIQTKTKQKNINGLKRVCEKDTLKREKYHRKNDKLYQITHN